MIHFQVLPIFQREVIENLFDLAKKNFKYKSYPFEWTVYERNQIQSSLGILKNFKFSEY